jgi:hypothetical protein
MSSVEQREIGVLTFHNGPNFGGFWQAWHLVHAIRSFGYCCHAVNYLHARHHAANRVAIPVRSFSALKARAFWWLRHRAFAGMGDLLCNVPFVDHADLVPWQRYGGFVVGSDIVWDFEDENFGRDPVYFGMHPAQLGKPIMSYAASCGPANVDGAIPGYVQEGLRRFNAISVRDGATKRMVVRAVEREAILVADPTLLQDDPAFDWGGLPRKEYVLLYGGGLTARAERDLAAHCRRRGLQLVSAGTPCKSADRVCRLINPFQWAELFRHCSAAVVGTFHGTLYSIKNNKPFIVINNPRIAPKLVETLRRTGQGFRLVEGAAVTQETLELLDRAAGPLPEVPHAWRQESLDFLRDGLAAFTE